MTPSLLIGLALVVWVAALAVSDLRHRRLPNLWLAAGALPALAWLVSQGTSLAGAAWPAAAGGVALALVLTLPGYALRQLGAGDAKMLMVIGLMSSWQHVLVTAAIAGGLALLWAVVQFVYTHRLHKQVISRAPRRHLPLGAGFAAGFVVALAAL